MMVKIPRLSESNVGNDEEGEDDIHVNGVPIPPQILAEILIRVNDSRDIGCVCPLVCRRWYNILSAPGFWINYMIYRSLDLPPSSLRSEPLLNVKKVSLKQPFGRNLISNPSGDENLQKWEIIESASDGFGIERPPVGCAHVIDIPVAFVSSFQWCSKYQLIDLWMEGIERAFLDEFCPPITVSDHCVARFDCFSFYVLEVQLLPDRTVPSSLVNLLEESLDRRNIRNQTTDTAVVRSLRLTDIEWQKVEHTFLNYPKGIRYVFFQHSGIDGQYWAGHYGSKMAKASVIVGYGKGERRVIS